MSSRALGALPGGPVGWRRWSIALLLAVGIMVNYFDRINVSVSLRPMMDRFGLDELSMGFVFSAYLWSYVLLQIPVGALLDRLGVGLIMRVSIALWAVATLLTALAPNLTCLILARILLGVAEAPTFPACAKAVGAWFPLGERGVATALFDAAAKFSNVIGTPMVAVVVATFGWQAGFAACGLVTLVYGAAFGLLYREPEDDPHLSPAERSYVLQRRGHQGEPSSLRTSALVSYLLRQPKIWGLMLGFGGYGYAFYMLITWLPGYLQRELHMTMLATGIFTAVPWGVATATDVLIGGWLVDRLIRAGLDSTRVRKSLVVVGMTLGLAILGATQTVNPSWALLWISVSLGGLAFVAPIAWSLPALVAPPGAVGLVGALMNTSNNLMGLLAPIVTGYLVTRTHSFAPAFGVTGLVLAGGILSYLLLLGRIEALDGGDGSKETRDPSP